MTGLFWNVLLASCWVFLTGSFEALNYLFGFFIGYVVIALIHRHVPVLKDYPMKLPRFLNFVGFMIVELVVSNIKVAIDIITPPWHMKPGVVGFELTASTDLEITLVGNMISLTPGTLCLDVSDDRKTMFVHAMFLHDEDEVREQLRAIEVRLLKVMR
jgi:multicomponent Na+:H+ antiporter subunit E